MSLEADWLQTLERAQNALRARVAAMPDEQLYRQHHPDLSPVGWHVGHCTFIELYWLDERVLGDDRRSAPLHDLYFPELSEKTLRGTRLPGRDALLDWATERHAETLARLADPPRRKRHHPLLHDDYLTRFLAQHHAQHLETIELVLAQGNEEVSTDRELVEPASDAAPEVVALAAGRYRVGNDHTWTYDNESPSTWVRLNGCLLEREPVRAGRFLAFMEDGGYRRPSLWTEEGWAWRRRHRVDSPEAWRRTAAGWSTPGGTSAAVSGVSRYEAEAFARWAGGRLPHENEWEAACAADLLSGVGETWEWCLNAFAPYPGFQAYPYRGYSEPWFDGRHYVLRGGSPHTWSCVRRPAFRNFYQPDKRHIHAGVRVAYDA